MSGAGASSRRLARELLTAGDAARARAIARESRDRLDDELIDELVAAFNRSVVAGPAEADAAVGALKAAASASGLERARAHAVRAVGVLRHVRGRSRAAITPLEKATQHFVTGRCLLEAGDVQRVLMDVYKEAGDHAKARAAGRKAQRHYDRAGGADARRLASLAQHFGEVHRHAGRPDLAIADFDEARHQARRTRDPIAVARVEYNRANALATLDRTREAREAYEKASAAFADQGAEAVMAQCDYAIAGIDLLEGRLDDCLDKLRSASARQEELGDEPGLAHVDLEAADALLRLNRPREADVAAASALDWFRRAKQEGDCADAVQRRAGAALQLGRPKRALSLFEQARERHLRAGNSLGAALDDIGACRAATEAGRAAEGLAHARRAQRALKKMGLGSREARALAVGAEAARRAGRGKAAADQAERALILAKKTRDVRVQLGALLVLARIAEDRGETAAAYRRLKAAESCVEQLRHGVSSEESRLAFALDKSEVFERLVANRLSVGTAKALRQALEHAERGKARALAERVARDRLAGVGAKQGAKKLVDRLDALDADIARAEARLESPSSEPGVRAPRPAQVHRLLRQRERLQGDLARRDPERAMLTGALAPDPWLGVDALADDELALEYVETDGRFHLLAIDKNGVEAHRDLVAASTIRDRLDLLRFQLGKGGLGAKHEERFGGFVEQSIRTHLRELHRLLLAPVADRLDGRPLRIVPHGLLHGLPFHALEDSDGPLVERSTVAVVPSLGVAGLLARSSRKPKSPPLVLGVPDAAAPKIEAEVEAVRASLEGARVFRGEAATLEALRLSEARPSVLHVACHGFFGETAPGVAALRLGDAWVSLPDIYGLSDTAELVVLSGCETGRGLVHSGDEWVGLVRGFLQAGARAVVAALWEVHDETAAPLMADFHRELAGGASVAEALSRAQRAARARGLGVLRWAPFTVVGDPTARPLARRRAA